MINDAVEKGYIPVISTIAGGYHGETYNVNADVAAASIAAKLGAMKLILMTDVKGLLRDKDDEGTLIPVVNVSEVPMLKKEGIISGGMIPKIDCCVDAVRQAWAGPISSTAGSAIPFSSSCFPTRASAPCSIKESIRAFQMIFYSAGRVSPARRSGLSCK